MARFSLHKPGIFSKLWRSVKPAATRFPALFVLGIVAAVALTLLTSAYQLFGDWDSYHSVKEYLTRIALASAWGMAFSVLAQLLAERRFARRIQLAAQVVVFAVSLFALPPLFSLLSGVYQSMLLLGVPLALAAVIVFLLTRTQGVELTIPNCVISALIAGISCLCAMAGVLIVFYAFTELIIELHGAAGEVVFYLLVFLPLIAVQSGIFVAFAARKREQISLPAAYKVIMLRILLPIGIALLAVLYAYLFKCLLTLTMPVGKINPFVSLATGFYLFFYFAALPYESPFLTFFRKYGAIFLFPLIAAQIAAFAIRIDAYGYTPARVMSLLYIVFSLASCVLTLVRRGKHMGATFLVFAALCLLGSATPLNVIDTAMRSQVARIVRVYRSHALLADGVPMAEGAADALTGEEKRAVYESWRALWRNYDCSSIPEWAQIDASDFEDTFGFTIYAANHGTKNDEETTARFYLSVYDDQVFDVSAFSHLRRFDHHRCTTTDNGIFAEVNGENFDLTAVLSPYIPQEDITCYEPLVIPVRGGKTLILTYIDLTSTINPESDDDKLECRIGGYLCW